MGAQDLGTLSDYLVNGDNYERIDPATGNVLVIPGNQYGGQPNPPLAPQGDQTNAFRIPAPDCTNAPSSLGARCAVWVHDATTGFYHIGPIADYNPQEVDCICALASMAGATDAECLAAVQSAVDSLTGTPEFQLMPRWFLNVLDPTDAIFFQTFQADFWFIACFSSEIIIPATPPPPPTVFCPTGDTLRTGALCPTGFFVDPISPACCKPLDPPTPMLIKNLAGAVHESFAAPVELYAIRSSLRSTKWTPGENKAALPPPLPLLATMPLPAGHCGCGGEQLAEEIDVL
jgi:hypothetical protein